MPVKKKVQYTPRFVWNESFNFQGSKNLGFLINSPKIQFF
jgi:hypothetical protein